MKINPNQIYYTVESRYWGYTMNRITTVEQPDKARAIDFYKALREEYTKLDESEKAHRMYRLAKVQNGQSITLACCGYGVMDNFSFADDEPIN